LVTVSIFQLKITIPFNILSYLASGLDVVTPALDVFTTSVIPFSRAL
jgi:hypothetical protein